MYSHQIEAPGEDGEEDGDGSEEDARQRSEAELQAGPRLPGLQRQRLPRGLKPPGGDPAAVSSMSGMRAACTTVAGLSLTAELLAPCKSCWAGTQCWTGGSHCRLVLLQTSWRTVCRLSCRRWPELHCSTAESPATVTRPPSMGGGRGQPCRENCSSSPRPACTPAGLAPVTSRTSTCRLQCRS